MSAHVPGKMRAARVAEFNKGYKVEEVETPSDLGPNDVLINIAAAG